MLIYPLTWLSIHGLVEGSWESGARRDITRGKWKPGRWNSSVKDDCASSVLWVEVISLEQLSYCSLNGRALHLHTHKSPKSRTRTKASAQQCLTGTIDQRQQQITRHTRHMTNWGFFYRFYSRSCFHGVVFLQIQNMNLLSAALITQRQTQAISLFLSKAVKNLSSSISSRALLMYLERPPLLGLHLIRRLFSRHVRKPVTGKLQKKKRQDELLVLLKSRQKPFPLPALSRRYSSRQKTVKTSGLKRTFQLLRGTSQQDWLFENRREGKKENAWCRRKGKEACRRIR